MLSQDAASRRETQTYGQCKEVGYCSGCGQEGVLTMEHMTHKGGRSHCGF